MKVNHIKMAEARVKAKLSQAHVARELRVNRSTLIRWETGQAQPPAGAYYEWTKILGVSYTHGMTSRK